MLTSVGGRTFLFILIKSNPTALVFSARLAVGLACNNGEMFKSIPCCLARSSSPPHLSTEAMAEPPISSLSVSLSPFFFFFRRSLLRILSEKKKLDQTTGLVVHRRVSSRAAAVASIQLAGFVCFLSLFPSAFLP